MPLHLFLREPCRRVHALYDRAYVWPEITDRAPRRRRKKALRLHARQYQTDLTAIGIAEHVRAFDPQRVHQRQHVAGIAVIKVEGEIARFGRGFAVTAHGWADDAKVCAQP